MASRAQLQEVFEAQDRPAPSARTPDSETVKQLVMDFLPLVGKLVDRVWLSPRLGLGRDDLISAGAFGLLTAARRFEPERGVHFGVFARSFVHGAVMREINTALSALGIERDDLSLAPPEVEPDSLPDTEAQSRIDSVEAAEVRELMEFTLTEPERLAITLYYYEELTIAEIAAVIELPQGRVARTIKSALAKLKLALTNKSRNGKPTEEPK